VNAFLRSEAMLLTCLLMMGRASYRQKLLQSVCGAHTAEENIKLVVSAWLISKALSYRLCYQGIGDMRTFNQPVKHRPIAIVSSSAIELLVLSIVDGGRLSWRGQMLYPLIFIIPTTNWT